MTIGFPKPLMVLSLVLTASLSLAIQASEANKHWITDSKGCKVAPSSPKARDSVFLWSGACVDGYAEGEGRLQWLRRGKPYGRYTGRLRAGRPDGKGVYDYSNGDRYEGGFYAGQYDGQGVYTFANGARYDGDFVEGASTRSGMLQLIDGRHFETDLVAGQTKSIARFVAPSVLTVVCFAEDGHFDSSSLVRSSGATVYDDIVASIVKTRAVAGESLVREPLPGCHMVGVGIGRGEYVVFHNDVADVSAEDVVIRCRRGCIDDLRPRSLPESGDLY
jgi:hypothetical protein